MKTVFESKDLPFGIKVEQREDGKFRVIYGKQVETNLTYKQAAHAFGKCMFHALACDGRISDGD